MLEQTNALVVRVEALESQNIELQSYVDALQQDSVTGLADVLNVTTDAQGNSAAIFSGTNVHINNGSDATETINGLGNLIIGYDDARTSTLELDKECSDGQYADQITCESGDGVWAHDHKLGSHNLVIGPEHNYSGAGNFVAGMNNSALTSNSTISGGFESITSNIRSSISGGRGNTASGGNSSVTGGSSNIASGSRSSITGGSEHTATATYSTVSAGFRNDATELNSAVSGGVENAASGVYSSVSGGRGNTASGGEASVSGGDGNTASGIRAVVRLTFKKEYTAAVVF